MSQKFKEEVPKVSVDTAKTYLNGMVEDEWRGNGDLPHAVRRVARKVGVSHHQIDHIRRGRAKTCDVTLFEKIRLAYLDHCQKQIEAFRLKQQEASHDIDPHLFDKADRILSEIRQAKARITDHA